MKTRVLRILKVDVVLLINKVFQRIGIEHFDVNKLLELCKDNDSVWSLYANGYTIGMNQVEQDGSRMKCMKYKPHNISELSAFVAAIRPGFKSMYKRFEEREDFSYGINALDNLVRTEELPVSFLFYQEQVMSVLHYAGFPMDQCYGIIKAIAKKHPEKVLPLKSQFLEGFKNQVIKDEKLDEAKAERYSADVWKIVNDNVNYSFNSAHAYCVALDSLYQAWQKATYPFEFYEVLLQHYSDKGKKDKVSKLKKEMKVAFGIKEGEYKFRNDNRTFVSDKENMVIYPSLGSIKNITQRCADTIYKLKDNTYKNFVELLYDMKKAGLTQRQVLILIRIDYFSEFGNPGKLIKIQELFEELNGKVQLKKNKVDSLSIPHEIVEYYSGKVTEKQYNGVDVKGLLIHWADIMPFKNVNKVQLASWRYKYIGFCDIIDHELIGHVLVTEVNTRYTPRLTIYALANGNTLSLKVPKKVFEAKPIEEGDILVINKYEKKPKTRLIEEGKYENIPNEFEWWIKKPDKIEWSIKKPDKWWIRKPDKNADVDSYEIKLRMEK